MSWRAKIAMIAAPLLLLLVTTRAWDPYRWGMYIESMRASVPISFYGQIVDDQGNSLEGAKVHVRIRRHNWAFILGERSTTAYKELDLLSDKSGMFQVRNERGRAVDIKGITLAGYRFKPRVVGGGNWDTSFYFSGGGVGAKGPHRSDPKNPVIFEMEKTSSTPPGERR
jgi:hypothetical protein